MDFLPAVFCIPGLVSTHILSFGSADLCSLQPSVTKEACDRCTHEHLFSVTLLVSFTLNKIFEYFVLFLTNSENWSFTKVLRKFELD